MARVVNGTAVGGGSSLPTAAGANEIPVSSGAGTTYAATGAAGVLAALTARTTVSDSGWTDVTSSGTIARASGVCTIGVDSGGSVRSHRATVTTPECPALEIIGRFDVTTGTPGSAWWSGFSVSNAGDSRGYLVQVTEAAAVALWANTGGSYSLVASSGSVSLTSGEVWLRLVVTPSYVAAYYGTGSGSTPPTNWTRVTSTSIDLTMLANGNLSRVAQFAARTASGSGTYTVEWRDLQTRVLGLAP